MSAGRASIALGGALVVAACLLCLGLGASGPALRLSAASAPLVLHGGSDALFSAGALTPGGSSNGGVTVANAGSQTGRLVVRQSGVADRPGPGGGRLSHVLLLRVSERGRVLYSGKLRVARTIDLGELGPGQRRRLRFRATLPEQGAPQDNRYQAAAASATYRFAATAEGGVAGVSTTGASGAPGADRPSAPGGDVAGVSASGGSASEAGGSTLPFTGLPALLVGLAGLALLGLGIRLRRREGPRGEFR